MENIIEGLQITIIGMGVVFLALFILSLILQLFKVFFYEEKKIGEEEKIVKEEGEKELEQFIPVITAVMADVLKENEYVLNIRQIN